MTRILFTILDGGCDGIIRAKENKSALVLRYLKSGGNVTLPFDYAAGVMGGLVYTVSPGIVPSTPAAVLSLLGYDLSSYTGRGVFEALGLGLKVNDGDVAFRANVVKLSPGNSFFESKIINRRVNANVEERIKDVARKRGAEVKFEGYRGAIVFKELNVDPRRIRDVDPKRTGENPRPTGIDRIDGFLEDVYEILKGESLGILIRGASTRLYLEKHVDTVVSIDPVPVIRGIAKAIGARFLSPKGKLKFDKDGSKKVVELLKEATGNVVVLHFKAPDTYSHAGSLEDKVNALLRIEKTRSYALHELKDVDRRVVTCDHCTDTLRRRHTSDPVPYAILKRGAVQSLSRRFTCIHLASGELSGLRGKEAFRYLLDLTDISIERLER